MSQPDLETAVRVGSGVWPSLAPDEPRQLTAALARLSDRLLDAGPEQLAQLLPEALEHAARAASVDRLALAELTGDGQRLTRTHCFSMPGIPPWPAADLTTVPWYAEQVQQSRTLIWRRLPECLPPEAVPEAGFVASMGVKSHLMLPLKASGVALGCLGVSSFRCFRDWSAELVSWMEVVAGLFANALLRQHFEQRLHAVEDVNRTLQEKLRDRLDAETVFLQRRRSGRRASTRSWARARR